MIEREFIIQKTKEYYIKDYIEKTLSGAGISQVKLKKIPLGEKIIICTGKPSLIIGSKGSNIKILTKTLKDKFKLNNPQIEIVEVKNFFLDAHVVAERIAGSLERFGSARFKGVGHKVLTNVLEAGALGVELIISGKIPGARAKSWRFYQGYLKKCGDVAVSGVLKAQKTANLKSGTIGIKVAIMPPNIVLPDSVEILDEPVQIMEEIIEEKKTKKVVKKKITRKKAAKKKVAKKEEVAELTAEGEHVVETPVKKVLVKEKTESVKELVTGSQVEDSVAENPAKEVPAEEKSRGI